MGYSKSPRAVRRVSKHLDEMVANSAKITWTADDPRKLAYQLAEAFNAAKHLAIGSNNQPVEPYATYSRLPGKYIIRVDGGVVIADPRDVVPLDAVRAGMSRMTLRNLNDPLEIAGAVMHHKAPEMFFPDADESIVPQLYAWGARNGYFIIPSDDGITLTQNDPGDLAWTPEE